MIAQSFRKIFNKGKGLSILLLILAGWGIVANVFAFITVVSNATTIVLDGIMSTKIVFREGSVSTIFLHFIMILMYAGFGLCVFKPCFKKINSLVIPMGLWTLYALNAFFFDGLILSFPNFFDIVLGVLAILTMLKVIRTKIPAFAALVVATIVFVFTYGRFGLLFNPYVIPEGLFYIYFILYFIPKDEMRKTNISQPMSISKCIIYSVITLGVYFYVWIYYIIKTIQYLYQEDKKCVGELACIILVPFYSLYWIYTRTEKLYQIAKQRQIEIRNNSVLYLVLSIFGFSIIAFALLQNDINQTLTSAKSELIQKEERSITERLRELKFLYDQEILTEEEFMVKKSELLSEL